MAPECPGTAQMALHSREGTPGFMVFEQATCCRQAAAFYEPICNSSSASSPVPSKEIREILLRQSFHYSQKKCSIQRQKKDDNNKSYLAKPYCYYSGVNHSPAIGSRQVTSVSRQLR